jgi:hypothetical protein
VQPARAVAARAAMTESLIVRMMFIGPGIS